MKHCSLIVMVLFLCSQAVTAQQPMVSPVVPLITPDMPVDSATLHTWLHSGDSRLIAWAATFARERHDAAILAEMAVLLQSWSMPQRFSPVKAQHEQRISIDAVLDALIQENTAVPIRTIEAIADFAPEQAAILISRVPLTDSGATIRDWTSGKDGGWQGLVLARIAAMMLAKDPKRSNWWQFHGMEVGFVANVVGASEESLRVEVRANKGTTPDGSFGGAGDSVGRALLPGWPQVYVYALVENAPQAGGPPVVALGSDRISSQRIKENGGSASLLAEGVQPLNASTRHRLIAYWLGIPESQMTWQPDESETIVWTDRAAYERQLGQIVEEHREKLRASVRALQARGLMNAGEAEQVTPTLTVNVCCEIKPCPLP